MNLFATFPLFFASICHASSGRKPHPNGFGSGSKFDGPNRGPGSTSKNLGLHQGEKYGNVDGLPHQKYVDRANRHAVVDFAQIGQQKAWSHVAKDQGNFSLGIKTGKK